MNSSRLWRLAAACRPAFLVSSVALVFISAVSRPAGAADASLTGDTGVHVMRALQIHPRLRGISRSKNVFNATFAQVAGYPALPRAARIGVTVRAGGN